MPKQNGQTQEQPTPAVVGGIETNGAIVAQTDLHPVVVMSRFGEPIFSFPKNASVSTKYGKTSTPVAMVSVPMPGCGLAVDTAIYIGIERNADGDDELKYSISLPRGLSALSPYDRAYYNSH